MDCARCKELEAQIGELMKTATAQSLDHMERRAYGDGEINALSTQLQLVLRSLIDRVAKP